MNCFSDVVNCIERVRREQGQVVLKLDPTYYEKSTYKHQHYPISSSMNSLEKKSKVELRNNTQGSCSSW